MPERAIPQLSDLLTRALIEGDFDLYAQILTLPMRFTPRGEKPIVLDTRAELKADFEQYVAVIRLHGVTDIYRKLLQIVPMDFGSEARFLTHLLARATLLATPFETRMRMVRGEGGWKIAEIESSEGHIHWTMGLADLADGNFAKKVPDAKA